MASRTEHGILWAQLFDAENRLASEEDHSSRHTYIFVYDGDGQRVRTVEPIGVTTRYSACRLPAAHSLQSQPLG